MLTDSHTHIYLEEFENDLDIVVKEAQEQGVSRFILPNIDETTIDRLITVHNNYQNISHPLIGLHPCSVKKTYKMQLDKLFNKIGAAKYIGIGEIGIDLHWGSTLIKEQKSAFREQIKWAKKLQLPIVIHCRKSFDEIYNILIEENDNDLKGIFHCFSGTLKEAKKIIDLGFYLGIGGIITFKNSNLFQIIKNIELKNIVLETDAPYLAPHPMRGRRNEPKFLPIIAQQIAKIKKQSVKNIAIITSANIDNLFFK